jgi:hypothetical protein
VEGCPQSTAVMTVRSVPRKRARPQVTALPDKEAEAEGEAPITQLPLTGGAPFVGDVDGATAESSHADEAEAETGDSDAPKVYKLSMEEFTLVMSELAHFSISWDGRSRGSVHMASTTLSPKIPCLPEEFQSPKSVLLVGEMHGKDNTENMKKRMGAFWKQVAELYNHKGLVTFHYGGHALQVRVALTELPKPCVPAPKLMLLAAPPNASWP